MEMALIALAGIGILLFLFSYLAYIVSGLKHHPVTGLIAIFPVFNVLTLPSLWHKNGRRLIVGFIGLLIAAGSWMFGAEQGANDLLDKIQGNTPQVQSLSSSEQAKQAQLLIESDMQGLPSEALYRLVFNDVNIEKLGTLQGRIVRLNTKEGEIFEGRLVKIINTKAVIESTTNSESKVTITDIKKLSVMSKQEK